MSAMNPLFDLQDQLCYVKCGHCTTILLVSVPRSSMCSTVVTVRCGHCTAILSVNMMRTSLLPFQLFAASLDHQSKQEDDDEEKDANNPKNWDKSSPSLEEEDNDDSTVTQIVTKPPEKRQRAPSAYNCFIKEEIKRLKASNPCMSHKQAFSAASKNWAHQRPSQQQHESEGGSYGPEEVSMQSKYSGAEQVHREEDGFYKRNALRHAP